MLRTSEWVGKPAYIKTSEDDSEIAVKMVGRVHFFAFEQQTCVGVFIKRPDVAMMFRRKDLFAAISTFEIVDNTLILDGDFEKKSKEYLSNNKIKLDLTLIWDGMEVVSQSGGNIGSVDGVCVDESSGKIDHIDVSAGATSNVLLGQRKIDTELLVGFVQGGGARLMKAGTALECQSGCILVKDEALQIPLEGGVAQKAAVASVKAQVAAKQTANKVREKSGPAYQKTKETAGKLAKDGAKVAGKKYEETKQGLLGFKSEFLKAYKNEQDNS